METGNTPMNDTAPLAKLFGLDGTAVVVAGAAGLLGRACCRAVADAGGRLIATDARPREEEGIERLDLADAGDVGRFFGALPGRLAEGERLAFLNCAYPRTADWGTLRFENVSMGQWNENVSLQLGTAFEFSRRAVEVMKPRGGGSLLLLGSIYGLVGPDLGIYDGTEMVNPVPYAGVKAGLVGLVRYIAAAYGSCGIRANILCPGGIEGNQPEVFKKAYHARTPLGRMASPEDVSGAAAFLLGPSARYITGQVIPVDGGWTAW